MSKEDNTLKVWITTSDNPWNPFTNWDEWLNTDMLLGHNTCGLVATFAHVSDDMSDAEYDAELERAIDEIVEYDFLGTFYKVLNSSANK